MAKPIAREPATPKVLWPAAAFLAALVVAEGAVVPEALGPPDVVGATVAAGTWLAALLARN